MANGTWRNGDIEEGPPPQIDTGDALDSDRARSTDDAHTTTTQADR